MKTLDLAAWLAIRLSFGYIYLYPFYLNTKDRAARKATVEGVYYMFVGVPEPLRSKLSVVFAIVSMGMILVGGLSVLFGLEGRFGALLLFAFTLGGVYWHKCQRDVAMSEADKLALSIADGSKYDLSALKAAAFLGHYSSGLKNWALCGICVGMIAWGTGPLSITDWIGNYLLK